GYFLCISRVINAINSTADEVLPNFVFSALKADAACLVHLPFFTVQECTCNDFLIKVLQCLSVLLVCSNRTQHILQSSMGLVLIAFLQPYVKQLIELIQCLRLVQRRLLEK